MIKSYLGGKKHPAFKPTDCEPDVRKGKCVALFKCHRSQLFTQKILQ